ncbi:MAG TPA: hypothetical protein VHY79_10055 [Rhizomicrobium sp.]|nr:hypothetical protein [Rhizomicrobium sp.]
MSESGEHKRIQDEHDLCRRNPQNYLDIINRRIEANPADPQGYFDRHYGWMRMHEPHKALADLSKVIELQPDQIAFLVRGRVNRHLGDYENALADFSRGEAMEPEQWRNDAMGLLYQADCYARLGNEPDALACCARLPDNFWTPGPRGAPAGGKTEIANELRRIAAAARINSDGHTRN